VSGAVVVGLVVAVAFVAYALQVLSRQLQRFPLDMRRADALIDISTRLTGSVRPAELHQLQTVVANAILSDAAYRAELQPILDQLGATGPAAGAGRVRGRSRRSERIEQTIADLEDRWGIPR